MSINIVVKQVQEAGVALRALVCKAMDGPQFSEYFENEAHSSAAYYTAQYIAKTDGWGCHVVPTFEHWKNDVLRNVGFVQSHFKVIPDAIAAHLQTIEEILSKAE